MCCDTHRVKDVQDLRRWMTDAGISFQAEDYMSPEEYARKLRELVGYLRDLSSRQEAACKRMRAALENFEIVGLEGAVWLVLNGKGNGCAGSTWIADAPSVVGQGALWLDRQRRGALGLTPVEFTDNARILELVQQGHTDHCAKRQVWGDGECECGVRA